MMSSRSSENVINVGWVSIPCVTHQALAASGILPLAALVRRAGCPSAVSAGMRNNRHPCTTRSNTSLVRHILIPLNHRICRMIVDRLEIF